ncbi:unnamed protein product [Amaranthus hypochondriacus]
MVGSGPNEREDKKALDATVGGLVWVRRRNGSWWPGQIIGPDELSENGEGPPSSPRSGTPIKLLGRDDSIVDWHDLETTKGVKAFRCGEYDSCIERAKVTAAKFLKRSLKYPRREIAIFRALEIENGSNADNGAHGNPENGVASPTHPTKDSESSDETNSAKASACEGNSNSTPELAHSSLSYEEINGSTCLKGQQLRGKRRKTPNDSEDDGNEGFKRMKGLNDLGVRSERKIQVLALPNPARPNGVPVNGTCNATAVGTLANGGAVPTIKKKRSQVVHIQELLKRKYRKRPLTKVLENTSMVPVRILCDEFSNPFERSDAISSYCELDDGSEVKDTEMLNRQLPEVNSSGTLFDVPFRDEALRARGFTPVWQPSSPSKPCVDAFKRNSSRFYVQASSPEHEPTDNMYYPRVSHKLEKSASKWQSKGKRKARSLSKNDETISHKKLDTGLVKSDTSDQFSPSSNGVINGFTDLRKHISVPTSSPRSFSYHQSRFIAQSSSELPDVPSLYEVEVTVEATRLQAQHVPYISLMSKLSGKPITGHPLAVEALEDGSCDVLTSEYPASGSCELDDERTETKVVVKPKKQKCRRMKLGPHSSRRKGKSKSKKRQKRRSSSSKKTRKLSSITASHKLNSGKKKSMVQNSKGPTLACVPLKIVFSRINEALNGSTRSSHRAVALNDT